MYVCEQSRYTFLGWFYIFPCSLGTILTYIYCILWSSLISDQHKKKKHKHCRVPYKEYSNQICFQVVQWFLRKIFAHFKDFQHMIILCMSSSAILNFQFTQKIKFTLSTELFHDHSCSVWVQSTTNVLMYLKRSNSNKEKILSYIWFLRIYIWNFI